MNDDAYAAQLEQRLAELKLQIAEMKSDPARNGERRGLETQAGYIRHRLDAHAAAHVLAK